MGLENITGAELAEKNTEHCDNNEEHCGFAGFMYQSAKDMLMSAGAVTTGYLIYRIYSALAG
jgi:hypothetical protein